MQLSRGAQLKIFRCGLARLLVLEKLNLPLSLERFVLRLIGAAQFLACTFRQQHVSFGSFSDHARCDALLFLNEDSQPARSRLRGASKCLLPLLLHGRGKFLDSAEKSRHLP